MKNDMDLLKKQLKGNIQKLIDSGDLKDAKQLVEQYKDIDTDDIEAYSMDAVVLMMESKFDKAENVIKEGLNVNQDNFDLNYNLGYVYEQKRNFKQALWYYNRALYNCSDEKTAEEINEIMRKIQKEHNIKTIENKKKLVFFVKQGLDSFLGDIISGLSNEYIIRKIVVIDFKQIDEGMQWADICWFEWCDELVEYGSKLDIAKERKIICRLHRYEVFTQNPRNVIWKNVNELIIVTRHLKKFLINQIHDIEEKVNIVTINNGVNLHKYELKKRKKGFNIAYVGYIHSRKNPVLLLQIMNVLVKKDKRYKLYVAGKFQDSLIELYWNDQINKMNLQKNIIFEGWQNDIGSWLENKNYILSTSIHESFGYGIAEAMARGIKPVIHNFLFSDEIWDNKFMFNSIDEAVKLISDNNYDSKEYRKFIEDNYSLEKQMTAVKNLLKTLYKKKYNEDLTLEYMINMFNCFTPYTLEYIDEFNFKNAYIAIGKREMLSENIELVEFIVRNNCGHQLILTNILYDEGRLVFPEYILNSKNMNKISKLASVSLNLKMKLSKNMQGYIFDKVLLKDIKENQLAYSWERGIPATQFMPALGWLRIIERYKIALKFIKTSDTVLEAASGFGYGAAYFHDKCKQVYALDLAKENIEFGKKSYCFYNISWINGDVTKLPFSSNKFDVYTSFETLEHIPLNLVQDYFKEATRVLKSDGVMIVSTPNREMRKNINNPFHIKEYNYSEFDKILHKYFSNVSYYSSSNYKVEYGMNNKAVNMIAICSNKKAVFKSNKKKIDQASKLAAEQSINKNICNAVVKSDPLVTIYIPVYNGEQYIASALKSALSQTYKNTEIIVSDNCSTDKTCEIVKSFKNDKIKLIKNSVNIKYDGNVNKCIDVARGEYVKYLFADDMLHENCVEEMVKILENNNDVSLVGSNYVTIDENNNVIGNSAYKHHNGKYNGKDFFKYMIFNYNQIGCGSHVLIRLDTLKKLGGFDYYFEYMQDYDLFLRACLNGNYYFLDKKHIFYRHHNASITNEYISTIDRVRDSYKILKRYLNKKEFSDEEIMLVYKNVNYRCYYSLENANSIEMKLRILAEIFNSSEYIPQNEIEQLNDLQKKLQSELRK